MRRLILPILAVACMGAAPPDPEDVRAPIPAGFFRLASTVRLPGKSPDWDYLAYDQSRSHLFIARRGAGLWVFDTMHQRLVTRIADTAGAGATVLVPALGLGFAVNADGSTTVFDLARLVRLARVKFAKDADSGSLDPVTGRIAFISSDSRQVTFMDPHSYAITGRTALPAKKADGSAADGRGHILVNERDRGMVAQIDVAGAALTAEWSVTGCSQPTGMTVDIADHRAFIGCRGTSPVLAVMNTQTGAVVTTLPIGRGNDAVIYDPLRHQIIASNGIDANIVVFQQDDADHYRLAQAVTTRPNARTMAYDSQRHRLFTVTAEGVVNPAQPVNTGPAAFYPNAYYDDSFVVLTFAPTGEKD